MAIIQPLDLESIFVNHVAGSMIIFFFLAIAGFAYLGSRFRMPNQVFLVLMGLFVILMGSFGLQAVYTLVIFIAGLVFYYSLSKLIKT